MNTWLLLALAILAEVLGTSALRASEGFTRWGPDALVVLCYGLAFSLMAQTLKTTLVGWLSFRDAFNWAALGGIALTVLGVVVLNLGGGARR